MNQFHITGQIKYLNPSSVSMTIAHYPEAYDDSYFELGLIIPNSLKNTPLLTYDRIEVKGHWVSTTNPVNGKTKLVQVIDEFISVEHE